MNKKLLAALILPLMLLSLTSFAYAHWSDSVTKKYKLHAGTVEIEIIKWHIDKCTSYDVDCDGLVYGDEIKVENQVVEGQVVDVWITADPIFPSWELEFKMLIHNKGRLAVRFETPEIKFGGPYVTDPCFGPITDPVWPPPSWFEYTALMYKHDDTTYPTCPKPCTNIGHYTIPAAPTEFRYKPCECIMVKQWLHLKQSVPDQYTEEQLQAMLQCHWLRIDWEIKAVNEVGAEWGSVGYP